MQCFVWPTALGFLLTWSCFFGGAMLGRRWEKAPASFVQGGGGLSGGLLLAVACLVILPETFGGGFFLAIGSMLGGVFFTVWLETCTFLQKGSVRTLRIMKKESFVIWLFSLPELFLFGLLYTKPMISLLSLLPVSALHLCFFGISFGAAAPRCTAAELAVGMAALSVPYGICAGVGSLLGVYGGFFTKMAVGIFGGSLLYIVCGQILPEGLSARACRITAFCGLLGFLFGVLLVSSR